MYGLKRYRGSRTTWYSIGEAKSLGHVSRTYLSPEADTYPEHSEVREGEVEGDLELALIIDLKIC
jgi:hypothetical protein